VDADDKNKKERCTISASHSLDEGANDVEILYSFTWGELATDGVGRPNVFAALEKGADDKETTAGGPLGIGNTTRADHGEIVNQTTRLPERVMLFRFSVIGDNCCRAPFGFQLDFSPREIGEADNNSDLYRRSFVEDVYSAKDVDWIHV
jgi:hypothetical protein